MPDNDAAKSRLEAVLAELQQRLEHLDDALAEPLNPDSSERAVEMEDDASLEAQAALVSREIASVERALDRIAAETYGECVICGADIDPRRLEVRPEASLCINCARKES
ncbi:MAG: TraR/DksA family transcriptional regulator [Novosphingobium sp.]